MRAFTRHTGKAVFLDASNIDTDQIIPKQFLKRIERTGYDDYLFFDQRFNVDGTPNEAFPLNAPDAQSASILVAGRNFGCGSSREHAIWALMDFGFRVVIAPSFADIFANNSFQNGLLPIALDDETIADLRRRVSDGTPITVDLETCSIHVGSSENICFRIEESRRQSLLLGLDEIGRTLVYESDISAFEARRRPFLPSVV